LVNNKGKIHNWKIQKSDVLPRNDLPKAIVAMDTENLSISLEKLLDQTLNPKLINNLLDNRYNVLEKLAFIDVTRINGLRNKLQENNWSVIDIVTRPSLTINGSRLSVGNKLDVGLTVTTLEHCLLSKPDVLVLLSGDGDYIPLVDTIRARNTKIHVVSPVNSLSRRLLHYSDYLTPWEMLLDSDIGDNHTIEIDHGNEMPKGRSFFGTLSPMLQEEEVFRKIVEILREGLKRHDACIDAPELKPRLKKSLPYYDDVERRHGRFKDLLQKGSDMGYFSIQHEHPRLLVSLEHQITFENDRGIAMG